jgi:hypothetical protein
MAKEHSLIRSTIQLPSQLMA